METTIYRTGSITVGNHSEDTLEHWSVFDKRSPDGHVLRRDAIYASPDFMGARRWFDSASVESANNKESLEFHEIIVESDNVRVYFIPAYNQVESFFGNIFRQDIEKVEAYWAYWYLAYRMEAHYW